MKSAKLLSIFLVLILAMASLASCALAGNTEPIEINVSLLNGTTGFGAAKLMSDEQKNTSINYKFTVEADAQLITAGLINKTIDIAALPTNAAAALYNKTEGEVQIAAVNTLGVLYLVTNSEKVKISSISELESKTVYCPAQNPAYIFEAICRKNGLVNGEDITIDTAFASPADLRTAIVSGEVDIAILPEPMVTIAKSANKSLTSSLDITEEWKKAYGTDSLMQGCIVVRREWAETYPKELEEFLKEYRASIEFVNQNPAEAGEMIASLGIFAQAKVAEKAIPSCNITYVDGDEMKNALSSFFSALCEINPKSVGGKIPDSGIYLDK